MVGEAKHTKGPWRAEKGVEASDDMRCGVVAVRGKVGYLLATIENGAPGDFCDTEWANARLIAAAPSLLEAAADALAGWRYIRQQHGDLYGVAWDRVETALSAAIFLATADPVRAPTDARPDVGEG